jgi:hypothetical protein
MSTLNSSMEQSNIHSIGKAGGIKITINIIDMHGGHVR